MKYSTLLIISFLISGCATELIPGGNFIPLMQEKNDLKAKVSVSTNTFQSAVAYAPFNHIAFKADAGFTYNFLTGIQKDYGVFDYMFDLPDHAKNAYCAVSAGWFKNINQKYMYEIYTGAKFGKFKNMFDNTGSYFSPNINLIFSKIQNKVNFGFSAKLYYNKYKIPKIYYKEDFYLHKINFFSFEPNIFLKFGKNLKTEFQIGSLFPDKNNISEDYKGYGESIDYSKLHISVGLSYNFNHKNKKQ